MFRHFPRILSQPGSSLWHGLTAVSLFLFILLWAGRPTWQASKSARVYAGAAAALAYSTYGGGDGGDEAKAITRDSLGNIYLIGETESDDFLGSGLLISGFSDIFVAKFNPAGTSLLYLTLIGSTSTDTPLAIQVDSQGNAYVTALIFADDFPVQNALWPTRPHFFHNGVLFALNSLGDLVYSTYLPLDVFDARRRPRLRLLPWRCLR